MDFSRNEGPAQLIIQRIEAGSITVGGRDYSHSILVTPSGVVAWPPRCLADIQAEQIAALADYTPEIVLLGTGQRLRFPHPGAQTPLIERGIGVEVMDTAAACRTFNLLLSEDRRVVAALLIE
jgi:uncharacterized protein